MWLMQLTFESIYIGAMGGVLKVYFNDTIVEYCGLNINRSKTVICLCSTKIAIRVRSILR